MSFSPLAQTMAMDLELNNKKTLTEKKNLISTFLFFVFAKNLASWYPKEKFIQLNKNINIVRNEAPHGRRKIKSVFGWKSRDGCLHSFCPR